jgi:hypothetical protein
LNYWFRIFGMLGTDYSCTYCSFSTRWSFYFFGCSNTCWNWHFPIPDGIIKYMGHVTLGCRFLSPTFWELSSFFGGSPTWARICFTFSRCFFKHHANTSLFMCEFKGM